MRRSLPALLVALPAVVVVTVAPTPADALPAGFVDELVAGVASPTAVEQLPDGHVVVTEQSSGRVRLIDPQTGLRPAAALDLAVCTGSERGLLGFTHDPDFGVNGRVYVYYTRNAPGSPGGCVNRVSAFVMSGTTINPATEQVLIDNISSVNGNHNAGDLEIGNDGWLYVSTGDAGSDPRGDSGSGGSNDAARDLSLLNGKILRLDRFTGAPATGNPLTAGGAVRCGSRGNVASTPTSGCAEIFAWGLRNPYRFAFDPNTSATRFFVNDVGQSGFEEIDVGAIGADYGWNIREGACPRNDVPPCPGPPFGLTDPIVAYPRSVGTYITAGAFVPNGLWPATYDGAYFFADGGSGEIWVRAANGAVDFNAPFHSGAAGLADMAFVVEPDGIALYYSLSGSSQVRRIRYTGATSSVPGPQRYVPLPAPARAFDSRTQSPPARIRGGTTRLIDLQLPAGATSALVNLTMVRPTGPGYLQLWQPRTRRPATSNVNAPNANVAANAAIVPVDAQGRAVVFVRTTSNVVLDVMGYFAAAPGAVQAGRFAAVEPARLVDTRQPAGAQNDYTVLGTSGSDSRFGVPVSGRLGIPANGTSAVAMIVTGVSGDNPTSGYVTVHPGGTAPPFVSNLNVNGRGPGGGDRRANLVVAPVGVDGRVDILLKNVDDVVVDVVGSFTNGAAPSSAAGRYIAVAPRREVDTRVGLGFGRLAANTSGTLDPVSVPASAAGVVQNLTMAPSSAAGYVSAYPFAGSPPLVSNVNATAAGQVRAALAVTKLSGGRERFYSFSGTQLVVDVFGYFS